MISFRLNSGKNVHISGHVFVDVMANGDLDIRLKPQRPQAPSTSEILEQSLNNFDNTPSYLSSPSYLSQPSPEVNVVKQKELDAEKEKMNKHFALVDEGEIAFKNFVDMWKTNFGVEGEQPNRAKHLQEMMNQYSIGVIRYLKEQQGLTKAVMHVNPPEDGNESYEYRKSSRLVAENIAQVCSILCPPISEFLEYPFKFNKTINQ
jgi:hypothetical protein